MTLPGFSGETSLYKSNAHYCVASDTIQARGVAAQLVCRFGDCECARATCRGILWPDPQADCGFTCIEHFGRGRI